MGNCCEVKAYLREWVTFKFKALNKWALFLVRRFAGILGMNKTSNVLTSSLDSNRMRISIEQL